MRGEDGALATCEQAVDAGPSNALGHYCRGWRISGSGTSRAQRDCAHAVTLAPGEALGHYCVGRIAREAGSLTDAAEALARAEAQR